MFFLALLFGFYMIGSVLMLSDIIFPGFFIPAVAIFIKITGFLLSFTGLMVYVGREYNTGGALFGDIADPNMARLIHIGKSNAKFRKAKKMEPNRLRARGKGKIGYMNIKDTGSPINVAGHDTFITFQDVGHTVPLWVIDLVDKWKKKYGTRNNQEWVELHNQIKNVKSYADVEKIPFLKPVMADSEKRKKVFDMSLEQIRDMSELLFDGRVVNAKAYLDWSEGATPYDNESIIDSTVAHYRAQDISLRQIGGVDWGKLVIPLSIILIVGAIAFQIFMKG